MIPQEIDLSCLTIRRISERDVPTVVSIARECSCCAHTGPSQNGYPELAWSEESFFKEVYNPKSATLIAELGDGIVGYVCAGVVIDECHIQNIAVSSQYRGVGIGRALIAQLLLNIRQMGVKRAFLELRKNNQAAIRFYQSLGFKVVALRKDYYANPTEDGLMMVMTL